MENKKVDISFLDVPNIKEILELKSELESEELLAQSLLMYRCELDYIKSIVSEYGLVKKFNMQIGSIYRVINMLKNTVKLNLPRLSNLDIVFNKARMRNLYVNINSFELLRIENLRGEIKTISLLFIYDEVLTTISLENFYKESLNTLNYEDIVTNSDKVSGIVRDLIILIHGVRNKKQILQRVTHKTFYTEYIFDDYIIIESKTDTQVLVEILNKDYSRANLNDFFGLKVIDN